MRACILHIVMLEPLLVSNVHTNKGSSITISFKKIVDDIFHLSVHYVCHIMFVQCFEPLGRQFTNFYYYYYLAVHTELSTS